RHEQTGTGALLAFGEGWLRARQHRLDPSYTGTVPGVIPRAVTSPPPSAPPPVTPQSRRHRLGSQRSTRARPRPRPCPPPAAPHGPEAGRALPECGAGRRPQAGPPPPFPPSPPPPLPPRPPPAVPAVGPAMGLCLPCLGGAVKDVVETPDPEIKRRQLAEAAEKRQMEASSRGIKNTYSLEQKKKKQEEIEKRIAASGSGGEGGLRKQPDNCLDSCP
uniref:Small VCP interacting protein n=1 Tax=Anas platyrhynchos platyrhynchos TaxID=8840 RepID=A0A493TX16_ANAPP